MKGDDVLPFLNCIPLSNQGSCKYLIRADPLLSGSLFSHPFLFVILPRMVIRICDNQHSSTYIRRVNVQQEKGGFGFYD